MSAGVANTVTLYDDQGHPIKVVLQNGEYQLMASDHRTHDALDEIKVLLLILIELSEGA